MGNSIILVHLLFSWPLLSFFYSSLLTASERRNKVNGSGIFPEVLSWFQMSSTRHLPQICGPLLLGGQFAWGIPTAPFSFTRSPKPICTQHHFVLMRQDPLGQSLNLWARIATRWLRSSSFMRTLLWPRHAQSWILGSLGSGCAGFPTAASSCCAVSHQSSPSCSIGGRSTNPPYNYMSLIPLITFILLILNSCFIFFWFSFSFFLNSSALDGMDYLVCLFLQVT